MTDVAFTFDSEQFLAIRSDFRFFFLKFHRVMRLMNFPLPKKTKQFLVLAALNRRLPVRSSSELH